MNMKNILFIAALIFSAFASSAIAQETASSSQSFDSSIVISTSVPIDLPADQRSLKDLQLTQQQATYVRPDSKTRFKRYINGVVGPSALARQVAGAGLATWRNSPEEWGGQWEGFGKRVASNFGKNLIKQTTIYGLDEALKLDSHYYRSEKKDAGSKIKNALLSPVTARNSSGKRVIGVPRLVGTYSSSIIAAETWYPDRFDYKDGLRNGTISLGMNAAFNLFKEFIWKK
jgi:hypothetical protein